MNAGVALFGATTVSGLVGAFLVQALAVPSGAVSLFMIAATGGALAVMLAAICALYSEGKCGREMVRLHHRPHGPLARQGMAISQAPEGRKA